MRIQSEAFLSPDIHIVFPAQEIEVRRALRSTCDTLKALEIDELTLGTVEILLAEVTNNIVEHAYADTDDATISLSCVRGNDDVKFEIIDRGDMLPGGEIPPKQSHDIEGALEDLPEGGFGWGLIRDMATHLVYRRCEDQNILRFSIAREAT